jgi:hypothetical protein
MAQNQVDALRFSQFTYGGSARSLAMGNAFGALGADFSSLSFNPAGIGLYKSCEISFTPSLYVGKTISEYNGSSDKDLKYNFNLSDVGLVFAIIPKKTGSEWKGVQIGFGINRLANYNNAMSIKGSNSINSILDDYLKKAQGTNMNELDPFDTQLAFNTYLLDTSGSMTKYFSEIPNGGALQTKSIETSGSMNEFSFTIGANYNDRLYFAGSRGVPYLHYDENSTYRESDVADTISFAKGFKEMNIHDDNATDGRGYNFKFGLIYRITDWLRIGAAVQTPTFFTMKYNYSRDITAAFDDGTNYSSASPKGTFDYKLTTPLRLIGSLAFVMGKYAILSGDYEFVDYSDAQLSSSTDKFFDQNDAIHQIYKGTSNVHAGLEIKLAPISLRGGFQWNSSPFVDKMNDGSRMAYSGGLGLHNKKYFIDFAYVYSKKSENYYLYPSVPTPAKNDFSNHNFLITLGFRF